MDASDRPLIAKQTREGTFFHEYGALFQERRALARAIDEHEAGSQGRVDAYSAASSTYYAAAGNAGARAKKNPFWYWRAFWCLIRSRLFSDKMKREAGGLDKLSPSQLDVRASICGKCVPFWPGSQKEQRACLEMAIKHPDITPESKALVLIQMAEMETDGARIVQYYYQAFSLREFVSPLTVVRMIRSRGRSHAKLVSRNKNHRTCALADLELAKELAAKHGLADQVQKIGAEMAKL